VQTTGAILLLRLFKIIPPIVLILITIVRIPVFFPKKIRNRENREKKTGKSGNGDDLAGDFLFLPIFFEKSSGPNGPELGAESRPKSPQVIATARNLTKT
jgi:hypothetical protein